MYDMCACDADVKSCLCPILAAYAKDCAALGVKLLWRAEIDECKIHCSGGQTYQICGNSCTRLEYALTIFFYRPFIARFIADRVRTYPFIETASKSAWKVATVRRTKR